MSNKEIYQNYFNTVQPGKNNVNYGTVPLTKSINPSDLNNQTQVVTIKKELTTKEHLSKQDAIIDVLEDVVKDIKNIATDMNMEIEKQNHEIVDLSDHVDKTDNDIKRATNRVKIIEKEKSSCCWCVAISLIVVFGILVIVAIVLTYVLNKKSTTV